MYVYLGKLNWQGYGQDETFTIILPNGPVRVGDSAYLFFQWTVDAQGVKKPNWFQNLLVDKVTKTASGDDVFTLTHHYYKYEVTTQQNYNKLSVVMSNPSNFKSTMSFDRLWQSEGDQDTGTGRIWTGKINWLNFAENEATIFIVPEGFGEGKPVISIWQWTKSSSGKRNDAQPRVGKQSIHQTPSGKGVKFSFKSYYTITGVWDETTENLAVNIAEGGTNRDLAPLTLAALIERHSHDWNPPEPTPSKAELELRLPQAQPAIPRILTPLPFPRTLTDVLAHSAAFIDQAGYLAKYAEERFHLLDQDYHILKQQLSVSKGENSELKSKVQELFAEVTAEKNKAAELETALKSARDEAAAKQKELTDTIDQLRKEIADDVLKDAAAKKLLEDTQNELKSARDQIRELEAKLSQAEIDLKDKETRLEAALARVSSLEATKSDLETQLGVQKTDNDNLRAKIAELTKENTKLTNDQKKLRNDLTVTNGQLEESKRQLTTANGKIKSREEERDAAVKAVKEREQENTDLETTLNARIAALEKLLHEQNEV